MPLSVTPLSATDRPEALRPRLATGLPLRGEVESTLEGATPCRHSRTSALRNRETRTPLRKIDRSDRCLLVQWMKPRRGVRAFPPSAIGGKRGADFKVLDRSHIRRPRYTIRCSAIRGSNPPMARMPSCRDARVARWLSARSRMRFAACWVFTGVKLVYPWGRHFLRVCQKRIVRRCKRKTFQGFENFGRFYGRKYHKFGIAISGDVSRSFLMTYRRCEGSKSFGP
jgi:hypothetical protein